MPDRNYEILDSHVHFFTKRHVEERLRRMAADPRTAAAAKRNRERHLSRAQNLQWEVPESADDAARRWLAELDRAGVAQGVFMSPAPEDPDLTTFLAHSPRFIGMSWLSPADAEAPAILERERAAGRVGVKLYPVTSGYRLHERRCYPFYEAAERTGMFILIHYGLTVGYEADLNYANPLDLHPVLRDFPDVPFVIAHFGAGFMRECLMLAYQQDNVHFDTSGSNNWMRTQVEKITLRQVFERFLENAGAERILYGSDSTNFPRGYRVDVLEEQLAVLEEMTLSDAERALILGGNLKRLIAGNRAPQTPSPTASEQS